MRKTGTRSMTPEQRFWHYANQSEGCWEWGGTIMVSGYGQLTVGGKHLYAHRYAYELTRGPIPEGLVIDHLCRVRHCVNPWHMEAVTSAENKARGESRNAANARKTECFRGHPFTPENTIRTSRGARSCRECKRLHDKADHQKHRDARLAKQREYVAAHREEIRAKNRAYYARKRAKS